MRRGKEDCCCLLLLIDKIVTGAHPERAVQLQDYLAGMTYGCGERGTTF